MFFRIEGEDAKSVFEGLTKLLGLGAKALEAISKKWEWEAHHLEERATLTDEEVNRELELKKLEHQARMAKAQADIDEALMRQRRAKLQMQNMNRQTRPGQQRPNNPNTHERRNTSLEGNEGKGLSNKPHIDKDSKPMA